MACSETLSRTVSFDEGGALLDGSSQHAVAPARRSGVIVFFLWLLLWALVPALLVWGLRPYVRQATFSPDGRSQAELEADLNNRYAAEYLGLGGLLGMVGGGVALWLRRSWQVLALAVVVGAALVAAFDVRHAPPFLGWGGVAADALLTGGTGGVLLGILLLVVHRRTRRCT